MMIADLSCHSNGFIKQTSDSSDTDQDDDKDADYIPEKQPSSGESDNESDDDMLFSNDEDEAPVNSKQVSDLIDSLMEKKDSFEEKDLPANGSESKSDLPSNGSESKSDNEEISEEDTHELKLSTTRRSSGHKQHSCLYCGKLEYKIPRHCEINHKSEELVKKHYHFPKVALTEKKFGVKFQLKVILSIIFQVLKTTVVP